MIKYNLILILSVVLLLTTRCDSEDYETIPYVSENLVLGKNTDLARWNTGIIALIQKKSSTDSRAVISYPGTSLPSTTTTQKLYGNGVILYEDPITYKVIAYKLTCTYNPKEYNKLAYSSASGGYFVCPVCGSQFMVELSGYPSKTSKAQKPLETYPIIDDDGYLKLYY